MDLQYRETTEKIIGAAFEVHNFLGNGFQELIYSRALAWEMKKKKLNYERELPILIYYKTCKEPIGSRRADFVVENKVLIELKAKPKLVDAHIAQTLNYLRIYNLKVGLLINFGTTSMQFKRFIR